MSNIFDSVVPGWNHSGRKPIIRGNALRARQEIIGLECNGQRIMRDSTQALYMGDPHSQSLIGAALSTFPRDVEWTALYNDA